MVLVFVLGVISSCLLFVYSLLAALLVLVCLGVGLFGGTCLRVEWIGMTGLMFSCF